MRRPQELNAALVEEAQELDKKLRQKIGAVKKLTLEVGGILKQMREKELHKYIRKPGSRKGYVHFDEYASAVTGMSGSSVWMAMKIFGLTGGVNPVSPLDIEEMSTVNAYELAKVPTERRTPELIEKAKKTPTNKFKLKVQEIQNESRSPEDPRPIRVDFYRKLHPETAQMLEDTIADFSLLPAVRDGDCHKTLSEKALETICNAALVFAGHEITEERERLRREAFELPGSDKDTTEDPESAAPVRIPRRRMIRRVSDATGENSLVAREDKEEYARSTELMEVE